MTGRGRGRSVLYGFASTHDALDAERCLTEADIEVVPVPSPKEFGELCGIALLVPSAMARQSERAMRALSISWTARMSVDDS